MKKPAILAILTLLAPPIMAADDPCNTQIGTFHSCLTLTNAIIKRGIQFEIKNGCSYTHTKKGNY
jgi:hypothetical protein